MSLSLPILDSPSSRELAGQFAGRLAGQNLVELPVLPGGGAGGARGASQAAKPLPMTMADRYLWTLPMFHANGWTFTWIVTAVAGTHVCLRKVDPANVYRTICQERISVLCAAPTVLIGLIFFMPWLGLIVGAFSGWLGGKFSDYGIPDKFIKEVGANLPPGGSELFLLIESYTQDKFLAALAPYGGKVIQTSITEEQTQKLQEYLDSRFVRSIWAHERPRLSAGAHAATASANPARGVTSNASGASPTNSRYSASSLTRASSGPPASAEPAPATRASQFSRVIRFSPRAW